jgi:TonB family protein
MIEGLFLLASAATATPPKPKAVDAGTWVTNADYPLAAIRANEQGIVSFRLDVDQQGRVTGCTITASSGSSTLDMTTCRLLMRRGRFEPARDKRGRAVASSFNSRFRWVIPPGQPIGDRPGLLVVRIDLTPDGRVESCSSEVRGAAPPGVGEAQCAKARAQSGSTGFKQQAASYRTIRVATSISSEKEEYPIDGTGWGKLLQRKSGEIHSDEAGKPLRCVSLATLGLGSENDFCSSFPPALQLTGDSSAPAAHKTTFDVSLFGLPR